MNEQILISEMNNEIKAIGNQKITKRLVERAYNNSYNVGVCNHIANIIAAYTEYRQDPWDLTKKSVIDRVYYMIKRGSF